MKASEYSQEKVLFFTEGDNVPPEARARRGEGTDTSPELDDADRTEGGVGQLSPFLWGEDRRRSKVSRRRGRQENRKRIQHLLCW
jgi:hypothetical protein